MAYPIDLLLSYFIIVEAILVLKQFYKRSNCRQWFSKIDYFNPDPRNFPKIDISLIFNLHGLKILFLNLGREDDFRPGVAIAEAKEQEEIADDHEQSSGSHGGH